VSELKDSLLNPTVKKTRQTIKFLEYGKYLNGTKLTMTFDNYHKGSFTLECVTADRAEHSKDHN